MKAWRRDIARGYSLPELLVTLAVLGILTQFAVAAWRDQVRIARRSEALGLLLQVTTRQEQFRLQALRYASGGELGAAPPAGLGIDATQANYLLATTATASAFETVAIVRTDGAQADDARCWRIGMDSSGHRWAESRTGADTTTLCWRR